MTSILNNNIEILLQLRNVLVQLGDKNYKKSLKVLSNSSIGQHTRHILEFYQCLFLSVDTGIANYDARSRDLQIETNLEYSLLTINNILAALKCQWPEKEIKVEVSVGPQGTSLVGTTMSRELVYLIEHTIHHLAIINIALSDAFPAIKVPEHFGVAFSTILHKNTSISA